MSFGYLGFHAGVLPIELTTADEFLAAFDPIIVELGPGTDYQGALAATRDLLETDMAASTAEDRARTRYQILFHSDGVPEPQCTVGCDNDPLYAVCDTSDPIPEGSYVDFPGGCPEYNTLSMILERVGEIVALAGAHGVGELTFDTFLIFAAQEVVDARCGGAGSTFGYVWDAATAVLQAMADEAGGSFADVYAGERTDPPPAGEPPPYPYECDDRFGDCGSP